MEREVIGRWLVNQAHPEKYLLPEYLKMLESVKAEGGKPLVITPYHSRPITGG